MYCPKCGKENNESSKYCTSCGQDLNGVIDLQNNLNNDNDILKKLKPISIVGFIFSFLFPLSIIGLILSIIGLVYNNKYKKENGTGTKYFLLSLIGLIISILEIFCILFIILVVIVIKAETTDTFVGKWDCRNSYILNNYSVTTEFKDNGKFSWGKYGDELNNNYLGNYTYYKKSDSNLDTQHYGITMNIEDYTLKGEIQEDKSGIHETLNADVYISDDKEDMEITITTTNRKFYCVRVD